MEWYGVRYVGRERDRRAGENIHEVVSEHGWDGGKGERENE